MSKDYEVKSENNEVVGWIMFEQGEGYAFCCSADEHEEWGYATAEKAEDALYEYCYQNEGLNYSSADIVSIFRGECANEYTTHKEYVEAGAWERDYLLSWLETWGTDEFPSLNTIGDFCHNLQEMIDLWFVGVNAGEIDPEDGVTK